MRLMKRPKPSNCPKYSTVHTLSKTPSADAWPSVPRGGILDSLARNALRIGKLGTEGMRDGGSGRTNGRSCGGWRTVIGIKHDVSRQEGARKI